MSVETVSRTPRFSHGGARPGAGRKRGIPNRWPAALAGELRRLADEVARLHEQRRDEHEALPALLRRITEIERHLRLTESPSAPRTSRRYPLGA
jgi:hypothetical protein